MSDFVPIYDLESLTEQQRISYIKDVCHHLGVPDNLNLVALAYIDDGEGPAHLVAYAKRGATENVRNNLQIDVSSLTSQMIGGRIVFTATATSKKNGRQEIATGSKYIAGLEGTTLDDAIMTSSTRALRRVTLQFIGAGVLDESEVNQRKTVNVPVLTQPPFAAPAPTVTPSSEPGKDITIVEGPDPYLSFGEKMRSTFDQEKLRADAITQLNQNPTKDGESLQSVELVKKTRKPRGPNKKKLIDLGPSEPLQVVEKDQSGPEKVLSGSIIPVIPVIAQEPVQQPITAVITSPTPVVPETVPIPPVIASKPRLTPDQLKPFKSRLIKLIDDVLEPAGFVPKEDMGNMKKMRDLSLIMFPEIIDTNDLTIENWEYFLSTLESRIRMHGAQATVRYIEDAIS